MADPALLQTPEMATALQSESPQIGSSDSKTINHDAYAELRYLYRFIFLILPCTTVLDSNDALVALGGNSAWRRCVHQACGCAPLRHISIKTRIAALQAAIYAIVI